MHNHARLDGSQRITPVLGTVGEKLKWVRVHGIDDPASLLPHGTQDGDGAKPGAKLLGKPEQHHNAYKSGDHNQGHRELGYAVLQARQGSERVRVREHKQPEGDLRSATGKGKCDDAWCEL